MPRIDYLTLLGTYVFVHNSVALIVATGSGPVVLANGFGGLSAGLFSGGAPERVRFVMCGSYAVRCGAVREMVDGAIWGWWVGAGLSVWTGAEECRRVLFLFGMGGDGVEGLMVFCM